MRKISIVLAIAALAAVVPIGAQASHCNSRVIVFNWIHRASAAYDANATGCDLDPDDEIDLRLIYPGAIAISLRYQGDFGAAVPTLSATMSGIGFDNVAVTLTRSFDPDLPLAATYDSDQITLPQGRMSSGTLTVTVSLPGGGTDTTCYHTAGATC